MDDRSITLTRRSALRAGSVAGVGLWIGLHPRLAFASTQTTSATPAAVSTYLSRSTYTGLASTTFTDDASQALLQLDTVGDLADPALAGSDDAFRLEFASSDVSLADGIRTLSHPELGQFSVFIGPVGAPAATATYEVIVDRSIDPQAPIVPVAPASSTPAAPAPGGAPVAAPGAAPGSATTPPSGVSSPASAQTPAEPQPDAHEAAVLRIVARRTNHGLTVEVFLRPGTGVRSLRVGLRRGGRRLTGASAKVHGLHTRIELPTEHRLPAGHYEAVVTASAAHGAPEIAAFPISLR